MNASVGHQDATDAIISALQAIEHEGISSQAQVLVDMCAYAGTGNVLKIQQFLHLCDEHYNAPKKEDGKDEEKEGEEKEEKPQKDDTFQALAVIGISLVAMGEEIGAEMTLRQFNHLVRIEQEHRHYLVLTTVMRTDGIRRSRHPQSHSAGTRSCERLQPSTTHPRHPLEIQP